MKMKKINSKIKKMLLLELGIFFLVLIIFIAIKTNILHILPKCFVYEKFGILCPGCQGTRCVVSLLQGKFIESFNYHPVFFTTIIYLFLANIIYIINAFRNKEILKFLYPKHKFWIIFMIILTIFTIFRNII